MHHGNLKVCAIEDDLLAERRLCAVAARRRKCFPGCSAPARIRDARGEKKQIISSFAETMRWLLNEVERGMSKQRYKGLGEMNPEAAVGDDDGSPRFAAC